MNSVRNNSGYSAKGNSNYNGISNGMNKQQVIRYTLGFVGSVALTLAAYLFVTQSSVNGSQLLWAITGLAIIQLFVQMICFLHLGEEDRPRWRTWAFIAMTGALLLIVFGSIWIMNNLEYHMMNKGESDTSMIKESNKGF